MPVSADPSVVIVGASPGNSPDPTEQVTDSGYSGPTFGTAHSGFFYRDSKSYWEKVRALCSEVLRVTDPSISEHDALALSGHLNLGTGCNGSATDEVIEPSIVRWVSSLLGSVVSADIVITFGLNGLLTKKTHTDAWNEGPGGLRVNWISPENRYRFQQYSFRVWSATRSDGLRVLVCSWPNHPSRHPFAGTADSQAWKESLVAFRKIVEDHANAA